VSGEASEPVVLHGKFSQSVCAGVFGFVTNHDRGHCQKLIGQQAAGFDLLGLCPCPLLQSTQKEKKEKTGKKKEKEKKKNCVAPPPFNPPSFHTTSSHTTRLSPTPAHPLLPPSPHAHPASYTHLNHIFSLNICWAFSSRKGTPLAFLSFTHSQSPPTTASSLLPPSSSQHY